MGRAVIMILAGMTVLFGGFRLNIQDTANEAVGNSILEYSAIQSKYIAESAINSIMTQLISDPTWRGNKSNISISGGIADVSVISRPDISGNTVEIKSTSLFYGVSDTVKAVIDIVPLSDRFSRFSYFSDNEDGIWFYSSDTISGPVHTNGRFNLTGTPVFYGLISSVSPTYETFGFTDPQFLGGTNFGTAPISLSVDFTELQNAAQSGGHYVSNSVLYLIFQSDGTYKYKVGSSGSWFTNPIPSNGIIAGNRNIYVEGVVSGQVTVATTRNIYISDDIVYADDPTVNPESTDLLGLIAMDDVIILDNAENNQGCTIHASILAVNGSFRAANINFSPVARLDILGGIIQDHRGAMGRLGGPPSGYEKYYEYDERLEYIFPPFFPIAPDSGSNSYQSARITLRSWSR